MYAYSSRKRVNERKVDTRTTDLKVVNNQKPHGRIYNSIKDVSFCDKSIWIDLVHLLSRNFIQINTPRLFSCIIFIFCLAIQHFSHTLLPWGSRTNCNTGKKCNIFIVLVHLHVLVFIVTVFEKTFLSVHILRTEIPVIASR